MAVRRRFQGAALRECCLSARLALHFALKMRAGPASEDFHLRASTAIVLNAPREHLPVKPARAEDVKPPIRKVQGV
jgi:hypothetical protein